MERMSSEEGSNGSSPEVSPGISHNGASACFDMQERKLDFSNLIQMNCHGQIKELQTIIRNKDTTRNDFKFYADRLIRLVVEEGLNCFSAYKHTVTTPTGMDYEGVKFEKMNCAVSIVRSGEAMEKGLRDCCRSIRIGKILIRRNPETKEARVYYAKFPPEIEKRKILLLYPVLETGATVKAAIEVLKEHGVDEKLIVFVNLFASYKGKS
jgi:uracil phosphoribosyltransferase